MKNDWFVMATECHLMGDTHHHWYPRKFQLIPKRGPVELIKAWIGPDATLADLPKGWLVEDLMKDLDEGGVTVAFALGSPLWMRQALTPASLPI